MGNPDILLPLGVGLLTFVLAGMGVYVTLYPPDDRSKKEWWVAFVLVALVGCGLIAWQAIRSVNTQESLQGLLNKIQHNTEQPPTVNVAPPIVNIPPQNIPSPQAHVQLLKIESGYQLPNGNRQWLLPDKPLMANVFFTNAGPAVGDDVLACGRAYLMPSEIKDDLAKRDEKRKDLQILIPKFKQYCKDYLGKSAKGGVLGTGGNEGIWFTALSDTPLSQRDISNLEDGSSLLFLFFSVQYKDSDSHHIHRCQIAQPPAFNPEIWQDCEGFEDHK